MLKYNTKLNSEMTGICFIFVPSSNSTKTRHLAPFWIWVISPLKKEEGNKERKDRKNERKGPLFLASCCCCCWTQVSLPAWAYSRSLECADLRFKFLGAWVLRGSCGGFLCGFAVSGIFYWRCGLWFSPWSFDCLLGLWVLGFAFCSCRPLSKHQSKQTPPAT
jgi:hypothetical protein